MSGGRWFRSLTSAPCSIGSWTAARELTGARYAALGVLNETRTELAEFLTLRGFDDATHRAIGQTGPSAWVSSAR